ncbi:ATP-binding protein [Desulfosporosinus sp. BG]|uniref:sensor histidine kinase n=1 Tax=Desulfosporosinus sp. BG TaxID=1633135 RepID=UPI0008553374|nr:ATP-binding protein [Desulfosporosinus sp. BG]ODA41372.1 sensor histidine kinase [Desulfosporosinus sp. BG]
MFKAIKKFSSLRLKYIFKGDKLFDSLRLRLTLSNIIIMTILLMLFVISTYFLMEHQIFNQSEQLVQNIATAIESSSAQQLEQFDKADYFYIKIKESGEITQAFSTNPHFGPKELSEFAEGILRKKSSKGDFDWHDLSFTFLKVPQKQQQGLLIVSVGLNRELMVLKFLLAALFITGLICLGLAFYSSLYLANRALIPIRKSWQRQKDFVADASHELRTPLAVIQTNLELVMGNPKETVEEQEEWLTNIKIEVSHMTRLVEDLLFLARVDSEQQLLERSNFSLDRAINQVVKPFIPMANNKGIELKIEVEPEVDFYGDEKRISQLILILVDNAIKHTPINGEVRLKMWVVGNDVDILVSDTGEGIEEQHLDKIFERFYRIDKARAKSIEGTGLGLSIANWIVKKHKGTIKVSSIPGKETAFTIRLPKEN